MTRGGFRRSPKRLLALRPGKGVKGPALGGIGSSDRPSRNVTRLGAVGHFGRRVEATTNSGKLSEGDLNGARGRNRTTDTLLSSQYLQLCWNLLEFAKGPFSWGCWPIVFA